MYSYVMNIEELIPYKKDKDRRKGKGRRICWGGEEFIQFLAALAILPRTILKNRMDSSFFQIIQCKFNKLFPQTEVATFAFSSVFFPLL